LNVSDVGLTFSVVVLDAELTVRMSVAVWIKLPEVPVMVTGKVPVAAVLLAVSVRTLVLAVLAGLNEEAVTPLGRPETDSATFPVKPFCGVTVMVLVPLEPCVRVYGDAERLKFGAGAGAFTVRLNVAVWLNVVPEAPVTVTVEVPVVAVLLAASVSVLVPVVLVGLNVAVTPLGMPEADRATLPAKPLSAATEIVLVPLAPWVTVRLLGNAERLKFGAGGGAAGDSVAIDW
jgi:hypothetical protein